MSKLADYSVVILLLFVQVEVNTVNLELANKESDILRMICEGLVGIFVFFTFLGEVKVGAFSMSSC